MPWILSLLGLMTSFGLARGGGDSPSTTSSGPKGRDVEPVADNNLITPPILDETPETMQDEIGRKVQEFQEEPVNPSEAVETPPEIVNEPEANFETEPEFEPQLDLEPDLGFEPESEPMFDPEPNVPSSAPLNDSVLASADFFVATYGSDNGQGTIDDPLASIDRAVALARPGDTILVRGGVYQGTVSIGSGGEEGAPLTIMAYPGEHPVIDGSNTAPDTDLVSITDSYVHFEGFEVTGATRTGISVWSSNNVTIADNVIHDAVRGGIWIGSNRLGVSFGHLVENNDVFNTVLENEATSWSEGWARGIAIDVSTDTIVRDNAVFKNYGEGIGALSSTDLEYTDNIVYDNYSAQMYFDNSQNVTAEGNLLFHTGEDEFFRYDQPGIGILIANEHTTFEMATLGMMVQGNTFAGVEPVFYDGSYGWGGGISDSVLEPNIVLASDEVDPDWHADESFLL